LEARLLHAQMGSRARRRESPSHHARHAQRAFPGIPCVGQYLVRLDREDLTVDNTVPTPVGSCPKVETVSHDRLEVVLHQPLFDKVRLRQRAPDFFCRERDVSFDDDRKCFSCRLAHAFTPFLKIIAKSVSELRTRIFESSENAWPPAAHSAIAGFV